MRRALTLLLLILPAVALPQTSGRGNPGKARAERLVPGIRRLLALAAAALARQAGWGSLRKDRAEGLAPGRV